MKKDRVLGSDLPPRAVLAPTPGVRYEACGTVGGIFRTCGHMHVEKTYAEWCMTHNSGIYTSIRELRL